MEETNLWVGRLRPTQSRKKKKLFLTACCDNRVLQQGKESEVKSSGAAPDLHLCLFSLSVRQSCVARVGTTVASTCTAVVPHPTRPYSAYLQPGLLKHPGLRRTICSQIALFRLPASRSLLLLASTGHGWLLASRVPKALLRWKRPTSG
jgi:hypothetical protein